MTVYLEFCRHIWAMTRGWRLPDLVNSVGLGVPKTANIGTAVARVVVEEIAVAPLIGVAAARDHVHGQPSPENWSRLASLASRHGRGDESRPGGRAARRGAPCGRRRRRRSRSRPERPSSSRSARGRSPGFAVHASELARERHVDQRTLGLPRLDAGRVAIMPMNSTGIGASLYTRTRPANSALTCSQAAARCLERRGPLGARVRIGGQERVSRRPSDRCRSRPRRPRGPSRRQRRRRRPGSRM